jgi:hypothetical protein
MIRIAITAEAFDATLLAPRRQPLLAPRRQLQHNSGHGNDRLRR